MDLNAARTIRLLTPLIDALDDPRRALDAAQEMERQAKSLSKFHAMSKIMLPSLLRSVTMWVRHVAAALRAAQAGWPRSDSGWPRGGGRSRWTSWCRRTSARCRSTRSTRSRCRYKVEADRIVVYSIGESEVDDGGDLERPEEGSKRAPDVGFRLLDPETAGFRIVESEEP